MARHRLVAAALCALATALAPSAASAHTGDPRFDSLLSRVTPNVPGLKVDVIGNGTYLDVEYHGTQTVTIYGYNKDPYLRLSPNGIIAINLRSPAYYLNQDLLEQNVVVPKGVDPTAAPHYKVVSRTGRYQFHDHRTHWMSKATPQQVTDTSKRTKVVDWHVPLRVGSTTGAISGALFWRGQSGGAPVAAIVAFALIVLLGAGSVVVVRRRRRDPDAPRRTLT
ncbi:MAG: hypothetical protein QOG15_451 [Solirubrobacteraceae bacterium]|jgi:hypothetical protein|nr:hypothetical protein [Solirubrobacteraceae bacterium]